MRLTSFEFYRDDKGSEKQRVKSGGGEVLLLLNTYNMHSSGHEGCNPEVSPVLPLQSCVLRHSCAPPVMHSARRSINRRQHYGQTDLEEDLKRRIAWPLCSADRLV
jgi:hypothetical protein